MQDKEGDVSIKQRDRILWQAQGTIIGSLRAMVEEVMCSIHKNDEQKAKLVVGFSL